MIMIPPLFCAERRMAGGIVQKSCYHATFVFIFCCSKLHLYFTKQINAYRNNANIIVYILPWSSRTHKYKGW